MRTVSGTSGPSFPLFGGISEFIFDRWSCMHLADALTSSFLVKDAQQDIAGARLKA